MKKVTIRDVAKAAGVSTATISRAISGKTKVSPETMAIIEKAIRETGYLEPEQAPSASGQSGGQVYFVMKSLSSNKYAELLNQSMIRVAEKFRLRVVSVNIEVDDERNGDRYFPDDEIMELVKEVVRIGARGMIISGFSDQWMAKEVKRLILNHQVPIVFINRSMTLNSFNRILTGSDRGTYMAVQYLVREGRRDLLMIQLPFHMGKTRGFVEAVSSLAMEDLNHRVMIAENSDPGEIARVIGEALEENPDTDGIICCDDEIAAAALRKLLMMGKKVPEDIDLIGYNDNLAPLLTPPLSSVRVPMNKICETAIEMLLDTRQHAPGEPAKTVLLDPQLIIRKDSVM
ncbi:MAG: LacI family transcriptional regulator [Hungatella sp.]|nr:LacI family transcriptional regulator [Hungatella sp.]